MTLMLKDLTLKLPIKIRSSASLREAILILQESDLTDLAVVDDNDYLVGIINEILIIRFCTRKHIVSRIDTYGWISPYEDIQQKHSLVLGLSLMDKTKVKDIMTTKVKAIPLSTSLSNVAKALKHKKTASILVTDEANKLVGCFSKKDFLVFLYDQRNANITFDKPN